MNPKDEVCQMLDEVGIAYDRYEDAVFCKECNIGFRNDVYNNDKVVMIIHVRPVVAVDIIEGVRFCNALLNVQDLCSNLKDAE